MAVLYNYLALLFDVRSILVAVVVFLLLSWLVHRYVYSVKNAPPGPRSWPLIGCLPYLIYVNIQRGNNINKLYTTLSNQFGPVCCLSLPFGMKVVIFSGYEAVFQSLTLPGIGEDRPVFQQTDNSDNLLNGFGVIMSTGGIWKEHRRFSLTVLRGFGVGKRSFEEQIATESSYLMKELESKRGQPLDPALLLCNAVSNVICAVVFGKRFEYDDPEFQRLLHSLEGALDPTSIANFIFFLVPKLTPYLIRIPGFPKGSVGHFLNLRRQVKGIIDEHRRTYDDENMRDYIDVYLKEHTRKTEQGEETHLSDVELRATVQDLFLAGTETTSTTLRWAILYMLKFPHIQLRVHKELDSVVGRDRLPKLTDKPNLPYIQAVIHEIQRFACIVFITPPRFAAQNQDFDHYTIPGGAYLQSNLHSASHDPAVWEDPNEFRPERFLDDQGQFVKQSQQLVFGAGKRVCLGEQLARMELFIFYSHLMHRFRFEKPKDAGELDLTGKPGTVVTPYPCSISAVVR